MPGVVDARPCERAGRTEWEGFETATRAAAAGGVTTICDMPLNSVPVTTTPEAVAAKKAALAGKIAVDVALWGGLVPANARALAPLLAEGLPGCKCFLVPSGIDEFPNVGREDLDVAMPALARLGSVLLVHAELPGPIARAEAASAGRDPRTYASWLEARPRSSEDEAIALLVGSERYDAASSSISRRPTPAGSRAARRSVPVTETCPHYLTFAAEEIGDGAAVQVRAADRERENRERLWASLGTGRSTSSCRTSPAAPEPNERARRPRRRGEASRLQPRSPPVWGIARGFTRADVARWMCGDAHLRPRRKGARAGPRCGRRRLVS